MLNKSKINFLHNFLKGSKMKKSFERVRAVSGSARFKIILLLRIEKKGLNVSQLSKILNSSLSKVSHQLIILKKEKIVIGISRNRETIYKLNDHKLRHYLNSILK